ncbi:hypothetical protein VTK26DRAFT_5520 [Humicola hyalothermophila]
MPRERDIPLTVSPKVELLPHKVRSHVFDKDPRQVPPVSPNPPLKTHRLLHLAIGSGVFGKPRKPWNERPGLSAPFNSQLPSHSVATPPSLSTRVLRSSSMHVSKRVRKAPVIPMRGPRASSTNHKLFVAMALSDRSGRCNAGGRPVARALSRFCHGTFLDTRWAPFPLTRPPDCPVLRCSQRSRSCVLRKGKRKKDLLRRSPGPGGYPTWESAARVRTPCTATGVREPSICGLSYRSFALRRWINTPTAIELGRSQFFCSEAQLFFGTHRSGERSVVSCKEPTTDSSLETGCFKNLPTNVQSHRAGPRFPSPHCSLPHPRPWRRGNLKMPLIRIGVQPRLTNLASRRWCSLHLRLSCVRLSE